MIAPPSDWLKPHVFVVHSDITRLRCDAWLLPTDVAGDVTEAWQNSAPHGLDWSAVRTIWTEAKSRALAIEPWHAALGESPAPVPILTDVGGWQGRDRAWYLDGITAFAMAAKSAIPLSRTWRIKPLLAVPLIGTGLGGHHDVAGEMQGALLERLAEESEKHDVDFALVLYSEQAYTSAQAARRAHFNWSFNSGDRERLDALANRAQRGELVLFMGAGFSKGAGLPLWSELLTTLAAGLKFGDTTALQTLSPLDAAAILERQFDDLSSFRAEAARLTSTPCFGLGHALTAALPITERVTTNYDNCIEDSLAVTNRPPRILPYHPASKGAGWLLKLHGSIGEPQDIVLTRQDYLRYGSRRGALQGIVQALLFTRHMLFLGFSLRDDNFHSLVDEVRIALESGGQTAAKARHRFGSAFIAPSGKLATELWSSELNITELGDDQTHPRALEVALDYLAFAATSGSPHLLNDTYAATLTDDEKRLKTLAQLIQSQLAPADRNSPTFKPITQLLRSFGEPERRALSDSG